MIQNIILLIGVFGISFTSTYIIQGKLLEFGRFIFSLSAVFIAQKFIF